MLNEVVAEINECFRNFIVEYATNEIKLLKLKANICEFGKFFFSFGEADFSLDFRCWTALLSLTTSFWMLAKLLVRHYEKELYCCWVGEKPSYSLFWIFRLASTNCVHLSMATRLSIHWKIGNMENNTVVHNQAQETVLHCMIKRNQIVVPFASEHLKIVTISQ